MNAHEKRPRRNYDLDHTHRKKVRHPTALITVIITTLIGAAATAFGTGIGQHGLDVLLRHEPPGSPIQIDSVTYDEAGRGDGSYIFPQKLVLTAAQLRSLNHIPVSEPRYDAWFKSRGGVEPVMSVIKIVVQGNRLGPAQIIDMRPIAQCRRPLNGSLFLNSPQGGSLPVVGISFDLDAARPLPMNYLIPGNYFDNHTVSLKAGETWTFRIVGEISKHYCSYVIAMTVVYGKQTTTEIVSDHGKPFRVTALVSHAETRLPLREEYSYYKALYVGGSSPGVSAPFAKRNPADWQG